ncbi:MAG TPA: OsmC family protein [Acidimicrobiia bacterium]|nr:OsmC family protein [Acidimicrobiia bacterium]
MIDSHEYHLKLTGRDQAAGLLEAPEDGLPSLEVASPPEFGGPEGIWSPEHLFVASVSACLMTTFRSIAAHSGLEVLGYTDSPTGRLVRGEDGLYSIDRVTLRPKVTVPAGSRVDRANRLIEKAEKVCLISRSIRCEIVLEASVVESHQVGT